MSAGSDALFGMLGVNVLFFAAGLSSVGDRAEAMKARLVKSLLSGMAPVAGGSRCLLNF